MAINPQTGYVAGSLADRQALAGKIAKKTTTPVSQPSTGFKTNIGTTAPTQAGADRVNARSQARTTPMSTPARTQTFNNVDPTTGQPSSTITGGVPTTFTPKTTVNKGIATTPMGITRTEDLGIKSPRVTEIGGKPGFTTDTEKEKLTIRLEMGDPTLTEDDLNTARDYLTEKMIFQRSQDPTAGVSKAYDRIQEQYQRQIQEQERLRQQKEQELALGRETKLGKFQQQLNTIYEPEIKLAQEQGEVQKESVRQILSFSGFGRSTKTVEKLTEVDQNVDQRLRVIEAQKQAEAMRYQAQLEGADAETLSAMNNQINTLRQQANQLKLDSVVKIEELKLEASQKGDEMAIKQLQELQSQFLEDLNGFDQELSKQNGFLTGADGQPIYDESGKIQALPKNYDFGTPLTAANGDVSIPVFDEATGTFKMVPTGIRERVPGSGGPKAPKDGNWENVIDDVSGKEIQQRKLADGTMEYRALSGNKLVVKGTKKPYIPTRTSKITTYKAPKTEDDDF